MAQYFVSLICTKTKKLWRKTLLAIKQVIKGCDGVFQGGCQFPHSPGKFLEVNQIDFVTLRWDLADFVLNRANKAFYLNFH